MKPRIFSGCAPAIVTPFREGGACGDSCIDQLALRRLIDFLIAGGSDAIVVAGTTGESAVLSYPEHRELVGAAVRVAAGRVPVIAGAGSNSTDHALTLIRQAEDAGADALLLVTPYYNKTTQSGLIAHYSYLADRTALPILLYDVPSRTGMHIEPATLAELAKHPGIVGVKEAGTDFDAISKAMALCPPDFAFYSGNDSLALPMLALGGSGLISVAANVAPEAMSELCRLCLHGDFSGAAALHFACLELMNILFCEVNPIPVKAALELLGLCSARTRLPLAALSEAHRKQLEQVLRSYGML